MKIMQLLAGNEDGGLEKHVIELSHQLASSGIEVCVVAHPDFAIHFKALCFIPLDLTKSRYNPLVLLKLYRLIQRIQPDIIHAQANKATQMVISLKRFIPCKVVATLHNYKKSLHAFEKSDFVITVSDKIGEKLAISHKCTIYNGIAYPEVEKMNIHEKYHLPADTFIICSVGRFVAVKHFDILIQAIARLDKIHLVLVGDGYENDTLRELAKNLAIEKKITFTGMLNKHDVASVVSSSNLFVMTSEREGFPYTFVEAMFCKTPFLSTPVSDIEKFISHNYITPHADIPALVSKIKFIQKNYPVVREDFQSIFELSLQEFSIDTMTRKTIAIYQRLIQCNS